MTATATEAIPPLLNKEAGKQAVAKVIKEAFTEHQDGFIKVLGDGKSKKYITKTHGYLG